MSDYQTNVPRIVVVGGGVAGLALATKLGNKLGKRGRAEIVLVDRNSAHVWKPMLHTFAAGTSNVYQEKISYLAHAAKHGFGFVLGTLGAIDHVRRKVVLAPLLSDDGCLLLEQREVDYDYLILAGGSRANDFATPGIAENCHFIDDLNEAKSFNGSLYGQLIRAIEYKIPLNVAIVGGGATRVELAAELHQLMKIAEGYGRRMRPEINITLIESGPRILAAFPEKVAAAATRELSNLSIDVRVGTRVVAADQQGYVIADGSRVDASLRVWAAGVKAPDAFSKLLDLAHSRSGQIVVDTRLMAAGSERIFAVGDCSNLALDGVDRPLPPTAQVARQQALHLARYLPEFLEGKKIPAFVFRDFGSLVSLGKYNAFGTLGRRGLYQGGFIQGQFARLSHAALYRLHQIELHGFAGASLLWLSGLIALPVRPSVRTD